MSEKENEQYNKEPLSDYVVSPMAYLTALFVGLKLFNVIHWNWIWVLSPLWFPFCFATVIVVLLTLFELACRFNSNNKDQDKKE